MTHVLRFGAAAAVLVLLAACGGGDPDPEPASAPLQIVGSATGTSTVAGGGSVLPASGGTTVAGGGSVLPASGGITVAGDGAVLPASAIVPALAPVDCAAEKTAWEGLWTTPMTFRNGPAHAVLVDPYLSASSPRRLKADAWSLALANNFSGFPMRIDFTTIGMRFGQCGPSGQEVTLTVVAVFQAVRSESEMLLPFDLFQVVLEIPMEPGRAPDRTQPLRTARVHDPAFSATWNVAQDIRTAIPLEVWSDYLALARDPWMPPDTGCEAARYFWKDLFFKNTFRAEVNDDTIIHTTPIRLMADGWVGDIPEIPARYPGQAMVLLNEAYEVNIEGCVPGQPASITMTLLSRWFAVANDQFSPLFSVAVRLAVDPKVRLSARNPFVAAAQPLQTGQVASTELIETFIDPFDLRVISRYWYFVLQRE